MTALFLTLFLWTDAQAALLDSPRFQTRERATRALLPAAPLLAGRAGRSPEQARRLAWLLAEHANRTDPVRERRLQAYLTVAALGRLPWSSPLLPGHYDWLARAREAGHAYYDLNCPQEYPAYREATRMWLTDALEKGETDWRWHLRRLWEGEAAWRWSARKELPLLYLR